MKETRWFGPQPKKVEFRDRPSRAYPVVGWFKPYALARIVPIGVTRGEEIEGDDRWWVTTDAHYIWVGDTIEKPLAPLSLTPLPFPRVIYAATSLNVRSGPSTDYPIEFSLSPGFHFFAVGVTTGETINGENRWWRVWDRWNRNYYAWVGGTVEKP